MSRHPGNARMAAKCVWMKRIALDYRLAFDDAPWEPALNGTGRMKRLVRGSKTFRLVEMTPASLHPEWCEIGHVGLLVEGDLEIEFAAETLRYKAGDALHIPSGFAHRHRPRALSGRAQMFLIEDEA